MHTARSGDRNVVGGDRAILDRGLGYHRRGDRWLNDRWLGSQGSGGGGTVTPTLWDSYSEVNGTSNEAVYPGGPADSVGQTFTAGGSSLTSSKFYCYVVSGSATGNIVSNLYALSGTFGSSGIPTGSPLATSAPIPVASFQTGSPHLTTFLFTGVTGLIPGGHYCISIDNSATTCTASIALLVYYSSSGTHPGNAFYGNPGVGPWNPNAAGIDIPFYVYGTP